MSEYAIVGLSLENEEGKSEVRYRLQQNKKAVEDFSHLLAAMKAADELIVRDGGNELDEIPLQSLRPLTNEECKEAHERAAKKRLSAEEGRADRRQALSKKGEGLLPINCTTCRRPVLACSCGKHTRGKDR
jgi:hypothetical protein